MKVIGYLRICASISKKPKAKQHKISSPLGCKLYSYFLRLESWVIWLFCACLIPSDLLNLELNLCVNVLLAFCKRVDFILCAELIFSNSPCQFRQRDLEWCEEMRACQKGLIYFYTALLLSNAAHIFEIINPNVISFLSSISAVSINHSWHFFSLTANLIKAKTVWLYFCKWIYTYRFNYWC